MDQKEFLQKIKFAVLSVDEHAEVILFGSRARGDNRKDSDWDILVLTDTIMDDRLQTNITDNIYDIELEYSEPVSPMIVDRQRWNKMSINEGIKIQ